MHPGLAQCTLFSTSVLEQLKKSRAWSKYTYIGYNWDRCSDRDRLQHAQWYYGLLQSLPQGSCPAPRPSSPWPASVHDSCADALGALASSTAGSGGFTAVCRTWLYVRAAARYKVTLDVDTARGEFAAWAGVIAEGRTGRFEGVSYLSARGGGAGDIAPGGNRWSAATVRLGANAARVEAQARWYYVSSVVTGAGGADAARLQRWRVGVQALVSGRARGAVGCDVHHVDFLQGAVPAGRSCVVVGSSGGRSSCWGRLRRITHCGVGRVAVSGLRFRAVRVRRGFSRRRP